LITIYSTNTKGKYKYINWFSTLQKLFSNYIRKNLLNRITYEEIPTHTALYLFSIQPSESKEFIPKENYFLEAIDEGVEISIQSNMENKIKWMFDWNDKSYDNEIAYKLTKKFLHRQYGYFQLLTFLKRKIFNLFQKDTKNIGVPFVGGIICTEAIYWAIHYKLEYIKPELIKYLEQWNSNEVFAIEILEILEYMESLGLGKLSKLY